MAKQKKDKPKVIARQIFVPPDLWDQFKACALLKGKPAARGYITEAMVNQLKKDAPGLGLTLNLP